MNNLIKFEGCSNFRDLGGYIGSNGRLTKSGQLFRADSLSKLTDSDIISIKNMGVSCVIDLRYESEVKNEFNRLQSIQDIDYYNIPMFNPASVTSGKIIDLPSLYIDLIENASQSFKKIFETISEYLPRSIIFHCTAGKDRTGITAALLLMLAGVSETDIIDDYSHSYENLYAAYSKMIENSKDKGFAVPLNFLYSKPEYIQILIDHIKNKYLSAKNYLSFTGVSDTAIYKIIEML